MISVSVIGTTMNGVVARLAVQLDLESDALDKGLKKERKSLNDWSKSFKEIGTKMTAGITVPVVTGFGFMVKAASDLNEATSAVKTTYGDASTAIIIASKNSAQAVGLSQEQYLSASTVLGVFGKSAGLTGDALSSFSTELIGAAADMASFYNADPSEVLAAIQSGLTGETEPLRQFGIMMSDAAIQQEALNDGIWDGTGAMTEQQKVLARQNFIMNNLGAAQGDFARTSGGLANQMRILKAELADVAAQFGTYLLPYAQSAVTWVGNLMDAVSKMSDTQKKWTLAITGGTAAIGPLLIILGQMLPAITALSGPIGIVVAALGALGLAYATNIGGLRDAVNKAAGYVGTFVGALKDAFGVGEQTQYVYSGVGNSFIAVGAHFLTVEEIVKRFPERFQSAARGLLLIADAAGDVVRTWRSSGFDAMLAGLPEELNQAGQGFRIFNGEIAKAAGKVFDSIKTAIDTADWDAIGQTFGEKARALTIAMAKGLWDNKGEIANGIVKVITAIPSFAKWIAPKVLDFVRGFVRGLDINWPFIGNWMKSLPGKAVTALGNLLGTLAQQGKDLLTGFKRGIDAAWPQIAGWLLDIPTKAKNAVGNLLGTLAQQGKDLLQGLYDGITKRWESVVSWLGNIRTWAVSAVGNLSRLLWDAGVGLIGGLMGGASSIWNGASGLLAFLTSLPKAAASGIAAAANAAYNDLWSAGYAFLKPVADGVTWVWDHLIKPILDKIPDLPGLPHVGSVSLPHVGSISTPGAVSVPSMAMARGSTPGGATFNNTFQLNGYNKSPEELADAVGIVMAREMRQVYGVPA